MPVEQLSWLIRRMAGLKLNTLHIHWTDDQSFRCVAVLQPAAPHRTAPDGAGSFSQLRPTMLPQPNNLSSGWTLPMCRAHQPAGGGTDQSAGHCYTAQDLALLQDVALPLGVGVVASRFRV